MNDLEQEALGEQQAEIADMHDVDLGRLNEHLRDAVSSETTKDFLANIDDSLAVIETMKLELETARAAMRTWVKR